MRGIGVSLLCGLLLPLPAGAQPAISREPDETAPEERQAEHGRRKLQARLLLADGSPAAGYSVSVVGGTLSVPCSADGSFQLEPTPPFPFWLVAAGPDGELSPPIQIAVPTREVVDLRIPFVARDSVTVVTGVAPGLDLLPASAATSIATEALEQRPPQRVVDALESVAGASKLGDGADSVPALRGLARGRTLLLLDGARVTAERRAGPSATFVDPSSLAVIEVLRGPGSVVYGSDAFGGVLNVVTRDPAPDRRSGRVTLEGAMGGLDQLAGSVSLSMPWAAGAVLVEARHVDAADGEAGGGARIYNSGFSTSGASVRWLSPLGPGRLRASLQVDRVDDLGKAASDSRAIRAFYPREDSNRLTLSWIGALSERWDALEATLFGGDYRVILDRDRAPTASTDRRVDRSDTDAKDAQARAVAGRSLAGGRLQIGIDVHSRFGLSATVGRVDFATDSTTASGRTRATAIESARQISSGSFATWSAPLGDRWSVGIGVRGDRVASRNRGGWFGDRSATSSSLSGNLSATVAPGGDWSLTAQLARGFRVATLSDRYYRGPSGRGFVTGNPDLAPETSLQADLALRRSRGRTALALYAYRYRIERLVERYKVVDDFFFRNRGSATMSGVEAEAQVRMGERWSLDAGGAWSEGETGDGAAIDDQPAPRLFVGARLAERWGYLLARASAYARKRDPGPTEVERPGYALLDAGAGWQVSERFEVRLLVANLLDRRVVASPDESADRAPGRSLTLSVSGRF